MWADTLLAAEQQHVIRLLIWAGLSIAGATSIAAILTVRRLRSVLLSSFAVQLTICGLIVAVVAFWEWRTMHTPDLASATRIERLTWFRLGLDLGVVGSGIATALAGRGTNRNSARLGSGVGLAVTGTALLIADGQFAALLSR